MPKLCKEANKLLEHKICFGQLHSKIYQNNLIKTMTKRRKIATLKNICVTALLPLELYNANRSRLSKDNLHQVSKSIFNGDKGKQKSKFFET